MRRYLQFTKGQFEFYLRNILVSNRLGFLEDITESWEGENGVTWERIYTISTRNRAVKILLFSSVDRRTGKVRENGNDAVRMVLRWQTRNGYFYRKLAKHYRIATLFDNMRESIEKANNEIFNLNFGEFNRELNN